MKVKIGDMVIDGENEPVMVILSAEDKKNIANMLPTNMRYCSFPSGRDPDEIRKWMNDMG